MNYDNIINDIELICNICTDHYSTNKTRCCKKVLCKRCIDKLNNNTCPYCRGKYK
jgi:hypothetical protein